MSMIRDAIEKIVALAPANTLSVNERPYSDKPIHPVIEPIPAPIEAQTLTSIVDYVVTNIDGLKMDDIMIHVQSPTAVFLRSKMNGNFKQRDTYIEAGIEFMPFGKHYMDIETTIVTLQTHFVHTDELTRLLSIIGNIKEDVIRTNIDNGVSQTVTVKSGVSLAKNVDLPNPIRLKPYRTFIEIDQPESLYLFRMRKGPECAMMEADGGSWKIDAVTRIKEFFNDKLPGVVVLA